MTYMPDITITTPEAGNSMNVAVLSGKGGTGKTLISVNLAAVAESAIYMDCDVEEPNGHLYFKPNNITEKDVAVKIPEVDHTLCNGCRQCVDFCKFNALAYINDKLIVFDEICHSCGGCSLLCPEKALSEKDKVVGKIQNGISGNVEVHTGILKIGEPSGVPIIKKMLEDRKLREKDPTQASKLTMIDCPPGTACTVMESIQGADYCLLVAEPTVFGLHNLDLVYQLVTLFDKPFGVVLNKCLGDDHPVEMFCKERNIPILARLPFDAELGMLNAKADIAVRKSEKFRVLFSKLLDRIINEVQHEATSHS